MPESYNKIFESYEEALEKNKLKEGLFLGLPLNSYSFINYLFLQYII